MKKNKLRLFSDKKGYLFSFEKNFFPIKRVFFIQGKKNKTCGNQSKTVNNKQMETQQNN